MIAKNSFTKGKQVVGALRRFYSDSAVSSFETLAVSVHKKHVFHVELNRPKKLNTFTPASWRELKECFSALSNNPECRVIVLSAQGKHFTAGIDLNSMVEMSAQAAQYDDIARKGRFLHGVIERYQNGISALEHCVKPVLCLVHSACVGAGVDLITAADVRYCTEDSWFQVKEVDIGLAADVGTLQRLPKAIGSASVARELCFTARKFDSKEAREIGLVSKVFPDKETALKSVLEIAEDIATKSPVAVQVTKMNLVYSQNRTNEEGLQHIRLLNQMMLQSEDLSKSAIASISKDGPPEFENL